MFNFKPKPRSTATRSTFGDMRHGDTVALAFFRAGLCAQYGEDFSIGLTHYEHCGRFIDIIGNGIFRAPTAENVLFDRYVNVWPLAYYANKVLGAWPSVPVTETKRDTIVIAPIFDAGYNLDRNWTMPFAREVIAACVATGREVVVVGGGNFFLHARFPDCRMVLNSIEETCREIRSCSVFIGGDTGTTHYAAALESDCKIVSIYGDQSQARVQTSESYIAQYVTTSPPKFGYAPLVRESHEHLYLEFPNARVDQIKEFCQC